MVRSFTSTLKRVPRQMLTGLFLIAVIIFFVLYLKSIDFSKLSAIHFQWAYAIAATVFALTVRYWGVYIWKTILVSLGATNLPGFTILSDVYARAWMGRYIPGTVTWIAGKVYMASQHGISKSRLAVSSLLEGGMQIIAVMAVSMLLLGADPRLHAIPLGYKISMLAIGVFLILMLYPPFFNKLLGSAFLLTTKQQPNKELKINNKAVTKSFGLYVVSSFLIGIAEFFITRSIVPTMPWHNFFFIVGTFNLAGALGMLAVFVPSGIGVRDGVQLVLLSLIMPKEIALAVTIASRFWGAIVDVLFYAMAASFRKLTNSRAIQEPLA